MRGRRFHPTAVLKAVDLVPRRSPSSTYDNSRGPLDERPDCAGTSGKAVGEEGSPLKEAPHKKYLRPPLTVTRLDLLVSRVRNLWQEIKSHAWKLVVGFFIFATAVGSVLWAMAVTSQLTVERIIAGSQMILQIDSFLAAAWVAGFFYYWGGLERAIRRLRSRARDVQAASPKETVQFNSAGDVVELSDLRRLEWKFGPTPQLWVAVVTGLFFLILSGLFSVSAVLTGNVSYVRTAFFLMVWGVEMMIVSWFVLRYNAQTLSQAERD